MEYLLAFVFLEAYDIYLSFSQKNKQMFEAVY